MLELGPDLRALVLELVHDLLVPQRVLLPRPLYLLFSRLHVTLQRAELNLLCLQLEVQVLHVLVCLRQPLLVDKVVRTRMLQLALQSCQLVVQVVLLVALTKHLVFKP